MIQPSENVPLAPYTSLGVGGNARFFVDAANENDVFGGLQFAAARSCPVFVLGGGSNLVVSDSGFDGLVLHMATRGIKERIINGNTHISAAAGENWDTLVQYAVDRNLGGIEGLSGIPGSVGAVPVQNVGAYGQEAGDSIAGVRVWDRKNSEMGDLSAADCQFSYRASIFNGEALDRYVILEVTLKFQPDCLPCIDYADVRKRVGDRGPVSIADVRRVVLEIRAEKAMVLTPGDPDARSAGSFFKNPVLDAASASRLEEKARADGRLGAGAMPGYPSPGGGVKIPAAWLIERAGFTKGYRRGAIGISSKHALAIVNRGGAAASDVLGLMKEIQAGVFSCFGVKLRPEPVFVGFKKEIFE